MEETKAYTIIRRHGTYEDKIIEGMEEPIYVNGYHGYFFCDFDIRWLNPDVCDKYDIPRSEEELKQREMDGSFKSTKRSIEVLKIVYC